ncbi:MAG: DUF4440 domain-containing protein [Saprospiraceae bacterium]|nr:DUF4440 domain-containing protein [Saprospiraceae bacterium]
MQAGRVTEAAPALDMTRLKTDMQAMEDAYAKAYNAGDANSVVAYYADDATSMVSNEPSSVGKAVIIQAVQKGITENTGKHMSSFEVMDLFADRDFLIETGKSTVKDSTGAVIRTGKYMSLF